MALMFSSHSLHALPAFIMWTPCTPVAEAAHTWAFAPSLRVGSTTRQQHSLACVQPLRLLHSLPNLCLPCHTLCILRCHCWFPELTVPPASQCPATRIGTQIFVLMRCCHSSRAVPVCYIPMHHLSPLKLELRAALSGYDRHRACARPSSSRCVQVVGPLGACTVGDGGVRECSCQIHIDTRRCR